MSLLIPLCLVNASPDVLCLSEPCVIVTEHIAHLCPAEGKLVQGHVRAKPGRAVEVTGILRVLLVADGVHGLPDQGVVDFG